MITLITGGSGSGKSAFAEAKILSFGMGNRTYIATMYPFDNESHQRIKRHQRMRSEKQFTTIERYTDISGITLPKDAIILLECMSNLAANEMFQGDGAKEKTVSVIIEGIKSLNERAKQLCIVTNEITADGIVYDEETTRYQSYLGEINRALGEMAQHVYEVVYGIPIKLK